VKLYDAHNHLQDDRFAGRQNELLAACAATGVARMVVNGACESDWPQVLALARANPLVLPSFGYHPWYLPERTVDWQKNLEKFLDETPGAVGEIGYAWPPNVTGRPASTVCRLGDDCMTCCAHIPDRLADWFYTVSAARRK